MLTFSLFSHCYTCFPNLDFKYKFRELTFLNSKIAIWTIRISAFGAANSSSKHLKQKFKSLHDSLGNVKLSIKSINLVSKVFH